MSRIAGPDRYRGHDLFDLFVHDVLFPYAREALPGFLATHAEEPAVAAQIAAVQAESGASNHDEVVKQLLHWIDNDVKATPLKPCKAWCGKTGYEQGAYQAHLYDDVVPALQRWQAAGRQLAVYSSGSIKAQELFFGYSVAGDVRSLFAQHFDDYRPEKSLLAAIRLLPNNWRCPPRKFCLRMMWQKTAAAAEVGMLVCGLNREGAHPLPQVDCPVCADFDAVEQCFFNAD